MCWWGGEQKGVEWISCRCCLYGYFYSYYSQVQCYRGDSMKKYSERIPIPILQKTLQSVLLSGDGGEVGGGISNK